MAQKIVLTIFLFVFVIDVTFACNGYHAKVVKVENCAGPDAVVMIDPEFSVKLNKKCELVPNGCVTNKAFGTAVSTFKVQKDGLVMKEGKIDMCAMADQANSDEKAMLKLFGAPSNCPVPAEKICANEHKVDLSKYKAMLGMAKGNIIIDSDVQHDTGKSCFHIEIEIAKS